MSQQKYVYLFELDSVKKTDREIEVGQKALYNEIANNGNVVILTYNQLVDSRAFFSLLTNPDYYKSFIRLFELGAIKVSQFGDLRTVSQYIQRSVEDHKQFIYSALPLKCSQKHLTALMERSLRYSDLTEIKRYIDHERTEEECHILFSELVIKRDSVTGEKESIEQHSQYTYEEEIGILTNLYNFLSAVLRISAMPDIYNPPRDTKEYANLHLTDLLKIVTDMELQDEAMNVLFQSASDVIRELDCYKANNQNRSVYHSELLTRYKKQEMESDQIKKYMFAEAIIDTCYNYTCEISICNVSKHYDIGGLSNGTDYSSFKRDFENRLIREWDNGTDSEHRYLQENTNEFVAYQINQKTFPEFSTAVRIAEYDEQSRQTQENHDYQRKREVNQSSQILGYENGIKEQVSTFERSVKGVMRRKALFAILGLAFVCLVEILFNLVQSTFDGLSNFQNVLYGIPEVLLFLIVSEILGAVLSWVLNHLPWNKNKDTSVFLSLSDSISALKELIGDVNLFGKNKEYGYVNKENVSRKYVEDRNKNKEINYVLPLRLRKYINEYKNKKQDEMFAPSKSYPIADVSSPEVQESILLQEELFGVKYGVVYESRFNRMIVDPIVSTKSNIELDGQVDCYGYERILPGSGKPGVVALTRYKNKFVLLKQERHAIRGQQIGFPRGFAEVTDSTPAISAVREVQEELKAEVTKAPILIGKITPDSGLTGAAVSVYLVDVDEYTAQAGYEGILDIQEYTYEEMKELISRGGIDDGFTLSAMALYNAFQETEKGV